ncbi:hypothetical protein CCH79_00018752, partial [Gambusia affinis]
MQLMTVAGGRKWVVWRWACKDKRTHLFIRGITELYPDLLLRRRDHQAGIEPATATLRTKISSWGLCSILPSPQQGQDLSLVVSPWEGGPRSPLQAELSWTPWVWCSRGSSKSCRIPALEDWSSTPLSYTILSQTVVRRRPLVVYPAEENNRALLVTWTSSESITSVPASSASGSPSRVIYAKLGEEMLDYKDLAALPKTKAIYNIDRPDMLSYSPYISYPSEERHYGEMTQQSRATPDGFNEFTAKLVSMELLKLRAGEKHYHPTCARCARCEQMFGEGEEMYLQGEGRLSHGDGEKSPCQRRPSSPSSNSSLGGYGRYTPSRSPQNYSRA